MINLNEIEVRDKSSVFNNGKAGEAVVKIAAEKKKPTDKENAPDWKLIFIDSEDRSLNEGFYYLDPTRYANEEKFKNRLGYEASKLKHIVNALYGKDFEFPGFATPVDMLDGCMKLIAQKAGTTVKVGATFGTVRNPSKNGYLRLKSTFPFITGNIDDEISFSNIDLLERPQPKAPVKEESDTTDLPWEK
jgi:hypothetical protein